MHVCIKRKPQFRPASSLPRTLTERADRFPLCCMFGAMQPCYDSVRKALASLGGNALGGLLVVLGDDPLTTRPDVERTREQGTLEVTIKCERGSGADAPRAWFIPQPDSRNGEIVIATGSNALEERTVADLVAHELTHAHDVSGAIALRVPTSTATGPADARAGPRARVGLPRLWRARVLRGAGGRGRRVPTPPARLPPARMREGPCCTQHVARVFKSGAPDATWQRRGQHAVPNARLALCAAHVHTVLRHRPAHPWQPWQPRRSGAGAGVPAAHPRRGGRGGGWPYP